MLYFEPFVMFTLFEENYFSIASDSTDAFVTFEFQN
jgi:hypothetical protein